MKFVEDDPNVIINSIVVDMQKKMNEKLEPGDARRMMLEVIGSVFSTSKFEVNAVAKKRYAQYLEDEELDEYGAGFDVKRLDARAATVPVKLILPAVNDVDRIIPIGTRATADGKIYFKALSDLTIRKGQTEISSVFECMTAGIIGNEYATGTIKTISDSLSFAVNIENTAPSSGGAERESDKNYLLRIQLSKSLNAAGSEEAYEYLARSRNVDISDIKVIGVSTSVVRIVALMSGGRLPNEIELSEILSAVTIRDKKGLNDKVEVIAPTKVINVHLPCIYQVYNP